MNREEALKEFSEEYQFILQQCQRKCIEEFPQKAMDLLIKIREVLAKIPDREFSYFHFSLLRCDLINRKYRILFQAQNQEWFLDKGTFEEIFSIDNLFFDFDKVWSELLDKRKKYIGKINPYDVNNLMQKEIMICNQLIGNLLRFYFRDVEETPEFSAIKKTDSWQIRWGEYRGESVLLAQAERIPKTEKEWLENIEKDGNDMELRESYWYHAELTKGDCYKKDMSFSVFEECHLSNINFKEADLTGIRFRNCRLEYCNFEQADCSMAYFEHCQWIQPILTKAIFRQTVFTQDSLPLEQMDERQTAGVLVRKEK